MAVIDAILYNGERDIFDLRYNILKDFVDEFVAVEFSRTFSGNDKESHPIDLPKVSYHFITDIIDLHPNLPPAFAMEYNQREMIKDCLGDLSDSDQVFIGDCDEIWKPTRYTTSLKKLRLRVYAYHLNNRSDEDFALGPVHGLWEDIKNKSLNELRSHTPLTDEYFGWHFTNMGGIDKLKYKIESYGHQEFNIPQIKDNLEHQMTQNKDYIGRNFNMWLDESDWPPWITEHREDYKHILKQ